MPRYKLTISYDGTNFFGWQNNQSSPSIQGALEKAIFETTQETPSVEAASRTDRGVHAEGQVISFELKKGWEREKLLKALNGKLSNEIRVKKSEIASPEFHPTLEAKEKIYHYRVDLGEVPDPHFRKFSWNYFYPFDLKLMEEGAKKLLGTHDFTPFGTRVEKNSICTLSSIEISQQEHNRLQIEIRGDRFLYRMARTLAGTLLYISSSKISVDEIPLIFSSKDRKKSGLTAPAQGLFLHKVIY